jgi:hypothetical protein
MGAEILRKLIKIGLLSTVLIAALVASPVYATGEQGCGFTAHNPQAGELATSSGYIAGARATIEGQSLPLCLITGSYISGSFHWAAIQNSYWNTPVKIVQVGYGHCVNADNNLGLGTLCNGNYYNYWAWGSFCGGSTSGSGPGGPVPIRVGAAFTDPPPANDYYILRQNVGGVIYYVAYVNGNVLTGTDALGTSVIARVQASQICLDSETTSRQLAWFGETFNSGDSMGGWTGATLNHLDYNPLTYSVGSGWVATSLSAPNACNANAAAPVYTCTIAATNHIYIDTTR